MGRRTLRFVMILLSILLIAASLTGWRWSRDRFHSVSRCHGRSITLSTSNGQVWLTVSKLIWTTMDDSGHRVDYPDPPQYIFQNSPPMRSNLRELYAGFAVGSVDRDQSIAVGVPWWF